MNPLPTIAESQWSPSARLGGEDSFSARRKGKDSQQRKMSVQEPNKRSPLHFGTRGRALNPNKVAPIFFAPNDDANNNSSSIKETPSSNAINQTGKSDKITDKSFLAGSSKKKLKKKDETFQVKLSSSSSSSKSCDFDEDKASGFEASANSSDWSQSRGLGLSIAV